MTVLNYLSSIKSAQNTYFKSISFPLDKRVVAIALIAIAAIAAIFALACTIIKAQTVSKNNSDPSDKTSEVVKATVLPDQKPQEQKPAVVKKDEHIAKPQVVQKQVPDFEEIYSWDVDEQHIHQVVEIYKNCPQRHEACKFYIQKVLETPGYHIATLLKKARFLDIFGNGFFMGLLNVIRDQLENLSLSTNRKSEIMEQIMPSLPHEGISLHLFFSLDDEYKKSFCKFLSSSQADELIEYWMKKNHISFYYSYMNQLLKSCDSAKRQNIFIILKKHAVDVVDLLSVLQDKNLKIELYADYVFTILNTPDLIYSSLLVTCFKTVNDRNNPDFCSKFATLLAERCTNVQIDKILTAFGYHEYYLVGFFLELLKNKDTEKIKTAFEFYWQKFNVESTCSKMIFSEIKKEELLEAICAKIPENRLAVICHFLKQTHTLKMANGTTQSYSLPFPQAVIDKIVPKVTIHHYFLYLEASEANQFYPSKQPSSVNFQYNGSSRKEFQSVFDRLDISEVEELTTSIFLYSNNPVGDIEKAKRQFLLLLEYGFDKKTSDTKIDKVVEICLSVFTDELCLNQIYNDAEDHLYKHISVPQAETLIESWKGKASFNEFNEKLVKLLKNIEVEKRKQILDKLPNRESLLTVI